MRSFVRKARIDARVTLLCVLAAGLPACSKDATGPAAAAVGSVIVEPPSATVAVNSSLTLNAAVLGWNGEVLERPRISWASADAEIAEVSSEGVVTGRKVGTVLIAASSRGKDAFAQITVNPTPVSSVRLSTTSRSLMVGQTFQLGAETVDGSGNVLTGRPITWSSSNSSIASVNNSGVVTALAPGAVIITAASEGKSAVATVTVSQVPVVSVTISPATATLVVGQTTRLTAQLKDEAGSILSGRVVSWSTDRGNVATVSSEGVVTAISAGTATITATSEGRSGTATITVDMRPASAIIVSPEQVTLFAGQTVQLSALVTDDRGQVLTGKQVMFASSNTAVATVSTQGLVTAAGTGTATITATSEGATGNATITVAPDPVAAVEITPSTASILIGGSTQLTAIARNVSGQPLGGRTVFWSSSSPSLASVSSAGVVTGLAPGNAVIIASIEGKQASATVTVRAVPVAAVQVTPSTAQTVVGQTVTLTATTRDASGNTLTGRIVGWSSSNTAAATVNANGVVTGVSSGTATITATSEGVSGTASVTVNSAPAASVTVAPSTATVPVGNSTTLNATVRDGSSNIMVNASVSWSTSNSAIATVSNSGVVTGVAVGSATITARSGTASGTATITVSQPPIHHITVTPPNPRIKEDQTIQLTATAYDASNNVITGVQFSWSSSNTNRATVSSTGLVRALNDGNVTISASAGGTTGSTTVRIDK